MQRPSICAPLPQQLNARALDHLHLKASMLLELCDPTSEDLRETLMMSLCRDVFLLEQCSFKNGSTLT